MESEICRRAGFAADVHDGGAVFSISATPTMIFGPVFFYDVVRLSRGGRFVVMRCTYAVLLMVPLLFGFARAVSFEQSRVGEFHTVSMPIKEKNQVALSAFSGLMGLQLLGVLLLTPIYTAGAIAEEKERRTLELLFGSG